jgi:DNA-binding NarL/FixJ family response regulator
MNTVHHERWLTDTFQVRKALAGELLPLTKGRHLGPRSRWSGWSVAIVTAGLANKEIAWKLKISEKP